MSAGRDRGIDVEMGRGSIATFVVSLFDVRVRGTKKSDKITHRGHDFICCLPDKMHLMQPFFFPIQMFNNTFDRFQME